MSDPQRAPLPLGGGRHAKRAAMIAQTEFWWAVSQDEKARPDGAPRPPDPWDVSISKRQWEKDFCEWRHALRQWRSVNLVEIDVEAWNNCDPDDETEYYAQRAILRYEAELLAEAASQARAQAAASQGPAPVASSSGAAASSSGGEPAASQRRSVPPYKAQPWPTSPSAPPRERWSWFWDERRQKWSWYWTE